MPDNSVAGTAETMTIEDRVGLSIVARWEAECESTGVAHRWASATPRGWVCVSCGIKYDRRPSADDYRAAYLATYAALAEKTAECERLRDSFMALAAISRLTTLDVVKAAEAALHGAERSAALVTLEGDLHVSAGGSCPPNLGVICGSVRDGTMFREYGCGRSVTMDTGVRCLDCGIRLCDNCARKHFNEHAAPASPERTDSTPSDAARDAPKGRTREVAANTFYAEFGIDYTDGYRVTVGWSEEDGAWIARVAGCAHDGACLADGPTKEAALLNLACSIAATLDAVEDDRAKAVAEIAAVRADERARVRAIVEGERATWPKWMRPGGVNENEYEYCYSTKDVDSLMERLLAALDGTP